MCPGIHKNHFPWHSLDLCQKVKRICILFPENDAIHVGPYTPAGWVPKYVPVFSITLPWKQLPNWVYKPWMSLRKAFKQSWLQIQNSCHHLTCLNLSICICHRKTIRPIPFPAPWITNPPYSTWIYKPTWFNRWSWIEVHNISQPKGSSHTFQS